MSNPYYKIPITKMNLKRFSWSLVCLAAAASLSAKSSGQVTPVRSNINLKTWQFSRDSLHWQTVSVPHDWAIAGPFDKKWDLQYVAIEQNGETQKTEKSGRSGALPWLGKGYYYTHVSLSPSADKRVVLNFDGAMAEPVVYVNGHRAGYWAYGYTPFRVDITPYIVEGDNTIAVSLISWP